MFKIGTGKGKPLLVLFYCSLLISSKVTSREVQTVYIIKKAIFDLIVRTFCEEVMGKMIG